jgi:hypothetical protein
MALVPTPTVYASKRGPFGDFRPKVDYGANEREKNMARVQLVTGSGNEDVKVCVYIQLFGRVAGDLADLIVL